MNRKARKGPASSSFRSVGRKTMRRLAAEICLRRKGLRRGKDPEDVHQMRVASRRLRAALSLFRSCLPHPHTKILRSEIKALTVELGAARDLDVLIGYVSDYCSRLPLEQQAPVRELLVQKQMERKSLDPVLKKLAATMKTMKLGRRLKAHADQCGDGHAVRARGPEEIDLPPADGPAAAFAPHLLMPRLEALMAWLPQVRASNDGDSLHGMRIDAKRLRYAMEPFTPLLGSDLEALLGEVKRIQSVLGEIHDCDVWGPMVSEFAAGQRAEGFAPLEALEHNLKARRDRLYSEFVEEWSAGSELEFRRRFLSAIAPTQAEIGREAAECS